MKQNGFAPIIILAGLTILLVILFVPFPHYEHGGCTLSYPSTRCIPVGWRLGTPIYKRLFAESTISSTITPKPTPVDETANWKTYTDKNFGYSLKYPSNISLEEMGVDNLLIKGKPARWIWLDKQIQITVSEKNIEQCQTDCPNYSSMEDIIVGGIKGRKLNGYSTGVGGIVAQSYQIVVIPHKDIYYELSLYELKNLGEDLSLAEKDRIPGKVPDSEVQLFNKILSTFKFL